MRQFNRIALPTSCRGLFYQTEGKAPNEFAVSQASGRVKSTVPWASTRVDFKKHTAQGTMLRQEHFCRSPQRPRSCFANCSAVSTHVAFHRELSFRATQRDRFMFSAGASAMRLAFWPKNGPVPDPGVIGRTCLYCLPRKGRRNVASNSPRPLQSRCPWGTWCLGLRTERRPIGSSTGWFA